MKTREPHHRHHGDDDVDWVADPPVPSRDERPVLWWGLTPRIMVGAAGAALLVGLITAAAWLLLPKPTAVPVPEDYLGVHSGPAEEGAAPVAPPAGATEFVHVAGEVSEPGLIELPAGSRVADAIELAGGPTAEADLAAINLAAPVVDGEQIYLPGYGEDPPAEARSDTGGPGLININTATESELQGLSGIGPVLAARIVADRDANGPFPSVDDLQRVSGIGPSLMSTLRSETTV